MTDRWRSMPQRVYRRVVSFSDQPVVLTVGGLVLCGLTAWVVLNVTLDPQQEIGRFGMSALLAWLGVALVCRPLVGRGVRRLGFLVDNGSRVTRIGIPAALVICSLVVLLVIGHATLREPGFDAQRVYVSAAGLVQDAGPTASEYFREYPNNIFLLLILSRYFAVLKDFGIKDEDLLMGAVVLNAVVLSVGLLLTYLSARRIGGGTVAVSALALAAPFVVISPWIGTPYSDTLGLVFPVAILYAFLRARDRRSGRATWAWWIVTGIITAIGYSVKPTVIFATIAVLALVVGQAAVRTRGMRSLLRPAAVVVTVGLAFVATTSAVTLAEEASDVVGFDISANDQAFPLTHFLKVGAQGEGYYSGSDVTATRALPPSERFGEGIEVYVDRVKAMGLDGYLDFLAQKHLRAMDDGSFFQWREGGMEAQPFRHEGPVARSIQDVYGPDGRWHSELLLFWQVMWVVVLGLVAAPLVLRGRQVFGDAATVMRLAVLGLTIFLLLFETRSRYVYLYVPFFAILAAISLQALAARRPGARTAVTPRRDARSST